MRSLGVGVITMFLSLFLSALSILDFMCESRWLNSKLDVMASVADDLTDAANVMASVTDVAALRVMASVAYDV